MKSLLIRAAAAIAAAILQVSGIGGKPTEDAFYRNADRIAHYITTGEQPA